MLGRQESRSIPGRLDSIDDQDELLAHENEDDRHNDRHSPLKTAIQEAVNSSHEDPDHACDWNQERKDITFSSPLPSLTPHEVFRYVHISELVSVEFEPRYSMDDTVDNSSSADNEGHHGDGKPDVGLEEDDSDVF